MPAPSGRRPRPCHACGKKFDYPVKGSAATRQPSANPACHGLRREAQRHAAFARTEISARSKISRPPESGVATARCHRTPKRWRVYPNIPENFGWSRLGERLNIFP